MLDNIESEYPGYDEYWVNADEIEHDPYVLICLLSAWYEGVFTLDEVQSSLEMLFEKQYILKVEEEVQVRYRTETRTDSEGNPYTVEVPYTYYICLLYTSRPQLYPAQAGRTTGALPYMVEPGTGLPQCPHQMGKERPGKRAVYVGCLLYTSRCV